MITGGVEIEKSVEDDTPIWRLLLRTCYKPNTLTV